MSQSHSGFARTSLEWVLLRDVWLTVAGLTTVVALCWAWVVPMARDMYGPMTGASAWMMTPTWDFPHAALLLAMWVVMMAGMMLPSAAPVLLLYAGVIRKSPETARTARHVYAFAGGYLVVWSVFSVAATAAQLLLANWSLISRMMEMRSRLLSGVILVLAGIYQLTPLKRACLAYCRAPAAFIAHYWRAGVGGGFRLGRIHGAQCLGCCWALMLLLFVGGVMNLSCILLLTFFVLVEKLAPYGTWVARLAGVLLAVGGLWYLVR